MGEAIESSQPASVPAPPEKRHMLRWLSLCVAGSAIVATLVLLVMVKASLPLSFNGSLLLAVLASILLPLLICLAIWNRLEQFSVRPVHIWCLTCLACALGFGLYFLI